MPFKLKGVTVNSSEKDNHQHSIFVQYIKMLGAYEQSDKTCCKKYFMIV